MRVTHSNFHVTTFRVKRTIKATFNCINKGSAFAFCIKGIMIFRMS